MLHSSHLVINVGEEDLGLTNEYKIWEEREEGVAEKILMGFYTLDVPS